MKSLCNKKQILSIDFDFFQNTNMKIIASCYPDGIDLGTEISEIVWGGHYAITEEKQMLETVTVNKKSLDELFCIIQNSKNEIPIMAANSHRHIYDFVSSAFGTMTPMHITNIDMHHDCYSFDADLDCGNWVNHIKRDFPYCELDWIANSISEQAYGKSPDGIFEHIDYDLNRILDVSFDMIFLCRSDAWTPPHLDRYMNDFLYQLVYKFRNNHIEGCVMHPRKRNRTNVWD